MRLACLTLLLLSASQTVQAQAIKNEPPLRQFTAEEMEAVKMPELAFEESDQAKADYDKYFYFHRADTDFNHAFADISECDALASGVSYYAGADSGSIAAASAQYGLAAGAVGGVIASVMMDAIFGSAERRKQRRMNIRNCMFYKGYDRYGLDKDLWQAFNFEEGFSRENAKDRAAALLMQAKVASGPKPEREVLEP